MKRLLLLMSVALGACSTIETRREDPPIFTGSTQRSLTEFQQCFTNAMSSDGGLNYLPRGTGGTYSSSVISGGLAPNRYTVWVLDIDDAGSERRLSLYAVYAIPGPRRTLIEKVQRCI